MDMDYSPCNINVIMYNKIQLKCRHSFQVSVSQSCTVALIPGWSLLLLAKGVVRVGEGDGLGERGLASVPASYVLLCRNVPVRASGGAAQASL